MINNNGITAFSYIGVGSNENSSFISMVEKGDMYISTPDNSASLSKIFVKSNQSVNLHAGVFDWNNIILMLKTSFILD